MEKLPIQSCRSFMSRLQSISLKPFYPLVFLFGTLQSQYRATAAAILTQIYTHMKPKSLHRLAKLIPTVSKNCVVSFTGQYWHIPVAEALVMNPPAVSMYEDRYCSQVCDPGASMVRSSSVAHCTGASPMAAERKLEAR